MSSTSTPASSYRVFRIQRIGMPRNHHAIFVETAPVSGQGRDFHVTGSIQQGMVYEEKHSDRPEDNPLFVSKAEIGWIANTSWHQHVSEICRSIPPPAKQFDGPRRLLPSHQSLRRCMEWVDEAVEALREAGVLVDSEP
ncbi:hypothetical protein B0H66DRAFT_620322 [Apodospora peruviana]|uniref:Uncharacterized protein n=1 Tax=Apodospora peruviana TaxID=516989 RepID=A0AAE0ICV4_9PEZI|nr:hypothetical protein B0H66DRAFT_620322 [Apodospora peruviana]